MKVIEIALLGMVLVLLSGCSQPGIVKGEDNALPASASYDCSAEDSQTGLIPCRQNTVVASDPETTPVFTALLIGNGYQEQFAAGMQAHTEAVGSGGHHSTFFVGSNAQVALPALWNSASQRAAVTAILDAGDVDLVGMTYDPNYPDITGYQNWVNHALSKNPDTRFFIATPTPTDPTTADGTQYASSHENMHTQVNTLLDAVRVAYPGVDFNRFPTGQGVVDLYKLNSTGSLPESSPPAREAANAVAVVPADDGLGVRVGAKPDRKPNILLIMADDLGFNDLAINNDNRDIDTPHMDQIAREGVRFTRHYASAVCSPARAALLTGLVPERLGYLPNGRGISPDLVTLPEMLQQQGYTTWHIGKWHIGDLDRTAWPDHQGFDHWFGFLNQWRLEGAHDVNGGIKLTLPRYNDPWLESDSAPGKNYTGHLETILTDKALTVLSDLNAAQQPWFLNLWYYAPHGPVTPASEFAQKYPATPAGKYRALVNQLDTNIGRVVAHLDTLGALEDTIIVVVSDNGGTNAFIDSNTPFYGKKATLAEGGLRTPLLIKWPDESMNSQVIADAVSIEDIYPTLLESIGVTPSDTLDGKSFYRAVQQRTPITARARFWDHIMTPTWVSYASLSADGRWRFWQTVPIYGVQVPVLYDLEMDPTASQKVDLKPPMRPPVALAQMQAGYQSWYRDVHTVKTAYHSDADGSGKLTGMDFLRTPGFGTYTFGIALPDALEGFIAGQAGIWDINRRGSAVTARFGDLALSGNLNHYSDCHSIVVSGSFGRQVQSGLGPDRMSLSLYLDGVETQSAEVEGALQVADPSIATTIGNPWSASVTSKWSPPVILNTNLKPASPWTVASFSQSLCSGK